MGLCYADPAGGDVFVDGGAGGLLENPADIGFAQEKAGCQLLHRDILPDILIYVCQDVVYLLIVFVIAYRGFRGMGVGEGIHHQGVDHCKQLQEGGLLYNIVGIAVGGGDLVDVIQEALPGSPVQGEPVLEAAVPVGKAVVQVGFRGGEAPDEIRINTQHDPLVDAVVDLGQLVAFVLVDDEQVSGGYGIKAVVDEELLSPGDRIIQLVTVMDVHVHGFFFFVEMGDGKGFGLGAAFDGGFAGIQFFHGQAPFG